MNLEEVKQFINENKDNEEVQSYLNELKTVSKDDVEGFLETKEGKQLLQPKLDKYFSKGLETWKEKNLDALVEEKYKEKNPEETEEQKRIRLLEEKLNNAEKDNKRKDLLKKATDLASEKGLPKSLVDHFIGDDEETTTENLTNLENTLSEWVKGQNKLGGRSPHPSDPNRNTNNQADIQKQYDEAMKSGNMPLAVSLKNKLFNESGE